MIQLYVDGASKGNPGPGGAGLYAVDDNGATLFEEGHSLGNVTNNEAEYRALELGLEKLLELGLHGHALQVFADSQLMVRQLSGEYRMRSDTLRAVYDRVQGLLSRFKQVHLQHVPRAQNAVADALASNAAKRQDSTLSSSDGADASGPSVFEVAAEQVQDAAKRAARAYAGNDIGGAKKWLQTIETVLDEMRATIEQ